MKQLVSFCALTALFCLASGAQNLSTDYPFRATLLENGVDTYELFWRFDRDLKSITFAVRVNTTGWVGFGLSPNGEMPGSDVVIGWVDSNQRGYLDVSIMQYTVLSGRPHNGDNSWPYVGLLYW